MMNDFDGKFMQDEDLKGLLRQWRVPETPASLDNRVAVAYQQSTSQTASVSALYSQRDSEVVNMKFCNTCQEEFADRFSFCPVDGTPLTAAPIAAASQSAPAEAVPRSEERRVGKECRCRWPPCSSTTDSSSARYCARLW